MTTSSRAEAVGTAGDQPATGTSAATNDSAAIIGAADRLQNAADTQVATPPVRDLIGSDDVAAAYAVQELLSGRRLAGGARIVGRKIGLTAPVVQQQLGVDQPDFGVLFDDMLVPDSGTADSARLLQPKVEAEVAFVLGASLADGPLDAGQVRAAVDHAVAALEIVDSRVAGWDITIADTVADNGSAGLFVLGVDRRPLTEVEPVEVKMTLMRNGETCSTGDGSACLGDPLNALAWLARTARDYGAPLQAGDVVLSGALGPMVPVAPGDRVSADITGLGTVSVTFSAKESS